jgi:hypothetical protein
MAPRELFFTKTISVDAKDVPPENEPVSDPLTPCRGMKIPFFFQMC